MDKIADPSPQLPPDASIEDVPGEDAPAPAAPEPGGRPILRILGYVFLGLAFLLLFYGGIALWAWRTGESERQTAQQAEQEALVDRQIELASADIDSGSYDLALRRLNFVLANDPAHPEALDLNEQVNTAMAIALTPTVTPTAAPTVTPTPRPSETPVPDLTQEARRRFLEAEELVKEKEWFEAVEAIESFQQAFPDYRRFDVSEMLYESYVNLGLTLTRGIEIERGIVYLERAAELGDLSEEVLGEIFWAEQYLEGIVFYGIDWAAYLSYFRPMCEFAPLYQNSCGKLAEGLLAFAEQQVLDQEYCPAEALYREALRTGEVSRSEVEEQLTTATEICLVATPTPEFDLTLTPAIDGGEVVTSSLGLNPVTSGSVFPGLTPTPTPAP